MRPRAAEGLQAVARPSRASLGPLLPPLLVGWDRRARSRLRRWRRPLAGHFGVQEGLEEPARTRRGPWPKAATDDEVMMVM